MGFACPCYISWFALGDWLRPGFTARTHRPRQRGGRSCPTIANQARCLTTRPRLFSLLLLLPLPWHLHRG